MKKIILLLVVLASLVLGSIVVDAGYVCCMCSDDSQATMYSPANCASGGKLEKDCGKWCVKHDTGKDDPWCKVNACPKVASTKSYNVDTSDVIFGDGIEYNDANPYASVMSVFYDDTVNVFYTTQLENVGIGPEIICAFGTSSNAAVGYTYGVVNYDISSCQDPTGITYTNTFAGLSITDSGNVKVIEGSFRTNEPTEPDGCLSVQAGECLTISVLTDLDPTVLDPDHANYLTDLLFKSSVDEPSGASPPTGETYSGWDVYRDAPPPITPEFSTVGILLALVVITAGLGVFIYKKRK